ncbi:hypothetical protein IAT38_002714 [Cryptococcus sp. DSM 104549]
MSEQNSPIPVFTPTTIYSPFGIKTPQADSPHTSRASEALTPYFEDAFDPKTITIIAPSTNTSTLSIPSSTPSIPSSTPSATSTALTQPDLPLSDDASATSNKATEDALVTCDGKTLIHAQRVARRRHLVVNTLLANGKLGFRYTTVRNQCQSDLHIREGPDTHPEDWAAELNNRLRPPFPVNQVWMRSSCSKSAVCRQWLVEHGKISHEEARAMRKTWEDLLGLLEATSAVAMSFGQTGNGERELSKKERKKQEKMEAKERKRQEKWEAEMRGEKKKSWRAKLSDAIVVFYS